MVYMVISTIIDFKKHNWTWLALDVVVIAIVTFNIYRDWAWYPEKKEDGDQSLDKTKELKDSWKDSL